MLFFSPGSLAEQSEFRGVQMEEACGWKKSPVAAGKWDTELSSVTRWNHREVRASGCGHLFSKFSPTTCPSILPAWQNPTEFASQLLLSLTLLSSWFFLLGRIWFLFVLTWVKEAQRSLITVFNIRGAPPKGSWGSRSEHVVQEFQEREVPPSRCVRTKRRLSYRETPPLSKELLFLEISFLCLPESNPNYKTRTG